MSARTLRPDQYDGLVSLPEQLVCQQLAEAFSLVGSFQVIGEAVIEELSQPFQFILSLAYGIRFFMYIICRWSPGHVDLDDANLITRTCKEGFQLGQGLLTGMLQKNIPNGIPHLPWVASKAPKAERRNPAKRLTALFEAGNPHFSLQLVRSSLQVEIDSSEIIHFQLLNPG